MKRVIDSKKDREMQKRIIARARYSLAIIGMSFVTRGSGRPVWLGLPATKR
jgi:hypothetical protein